MQDTPLWWLLHSAPQIANSVAIVQGSGPVQLEGPVQAPMPSDKVATQPLGEPLGVGEWARVVLGSEQVGCWGVGKWGVGEWASGVSQDTQLDTKQL